MRRFPVLHVLLLLLVSLVSPLSTPTPPAKSFHCNNDNIDNVLFSRNTVTTLTSSLDKKQKTLFDSLCENVQLKSPTKIQSLAWPALLKPPTGPTPPAVVITDATGSGKTLAYLLPTIHSLLSLPSHKPHKPDTLATPNLLILCPTVELCYQVSTVVNGLLKGRARVVTATSVDDNGGVCVERGQVRDLRQRGCGVIVGTPGRVSKLVGKGFEVGSVGGVVMDEIDVLLSDESFRPDLRKICGGVGDGARFVFVTATLPGVTKDVIKEEFGTVVMVKGPGAHKTPETLTCELVDVSVEGGVDGEEGTKVKLDKLVEVLGRKRCSRSVVFCNTVENCRKVENYLRRKDRTQKRWRVGCYHGGVSGGRRVAVLKRFGEEVEGGVDQILVCTDRAARGVDFGGKGVGHVVVFDFPKDPAEYVRRVGRAGRAGREGAVSVLAYGWQLPVARQSMKKDGGEVDVYFAEIDDGEMWSAKKKTVNIIKPGQKSR